VPSIYSLKPKFQQLLRPMVRALERAGVTANQVTLFACAMSVAVGCLLTVRSADHRLMLILPVFLFVRMALNAVDGMLAREFGQKTDLGAYLNELTDVVSDAFVYLPFAFLPPFVPLLVGGVIVLAVISEMAGVVGVMVGGGRRYDGPMGKSDRAFAFGSLALCVGMGVKLPDWAGWVFPGLFALGLIHTIFNRINNGLAARRQT
jgi:CDP-diacylglycerol--glycerol-3-phosphate 3-phosphatidyltransferase